MRTREKTLRLEVRDDLYAAVNKALGTKDFGLYHDPKCTVPVEGISNLTDGSFVFYKDNAKSSSISSIDEVLSKKDGRIKQERDEMLCQHNSRGMCDYCRPLEPWDPKCQKDAKHLSMHTYLKQNPNILIPEYSIYKRQGSCKHPAYPEGICSKCQTPAIALSRQPFRCTDHVEFANSQLVDNFINAWRSSGLQRFGWLIGRYEIYENVPLGVKARVEAIYEPPQEDAVDGIQLVLPDLELENVAEVCKELDMEIIGMVYTDLEASEGASVEEKRSASTFFLSSAECYFIAQQQLAHPIHTTKKYPSSRFVTAVLTGNERGEIDIFCYQMSLQAEKLVQAGIVLPSTDPTKMSLGSEERNFVPSVVFALENEYGVKVQHCADDYFPIDYLLVNLTHGFPEHNDALFKGDYLLPMNASVQTLSRARDFRSFNALVALKKSKLVLAKDWKVLLQDLNNAEDARFRETESFINNFALPMSEGGRSWSCSHCTFINEDELSDSCSMCGLPKN